MTITVEAYTGTHTVSTTEWSMTTNTAGPDVCTAPGVFQAYFDLSAMAAGDIFQFALYEKVITGGTQREVIKVTFSDAQSPANGVTPAFMLGVGWDMTLLKISSTDRSISWRISQVA